MTGDNRQRQARPETVALTREHVEEILWDAFCLDRDYADQLWDRAKALGGGAS